ncbi:hypothetical protein X777_16339 [Ooceraea biroi]|uniref:Uncharacterized protein n=1 Tax=Ooceraea biroi TaxID=2015173 RepID=A0A026VUF6_OOCBI|nr:hypothetical protein X777_16339 [Ooceraea biroi]
MKTLNNLVAGCKSRQEATLIDTRRRVPLHRSTARRVGVETRRGAAADNILVRSSFMTRGYEPGRAITPRGCQFLGAYRTINWKRDVCYLTPSSLAELGNPSFVPSSQRLLRTSKSRMKGDGKSAGKDMSSHGGSTMRPPITHWLKPSTERLMRPAYRRVRSDHSRWTGIIIRQRLPIGETSVGVAR